MSILVDTSVWSVALRRDPPADDAITAELATVVGEGRVVMIGPIRQELLSGIRQPRQFERLRAHLRAFPDLRLEEADYEEAASVFNHCRRRGIQGSNTDFLICATSIRRDLSIFTTDRDFERYADIVDLRLHLPR